MAPAGVHASNLSTQKSGGWPPAGTGATPFSSSAPRRPCSSSPTSSSSTFESFEIVHRFMEMLVWNDSVVDGAGCVCIGVEVESDLVWQMSIQRKVEKRIRVQGLLMCVAAYFAAATGFFLLAAIVPRWHALKTITKGRTAVFEFFQDFVRRLLSVTDNRLSLPHFSIAIKKFLKPPLVSSAVFLLVCFFLSFCMCALFTFGIEIVNAWLIRTAPTARPPARTPAPLRRC